MNVRMELGRTYFNQGFNPDAMSCFRAVLEKDPRNCDAHFLVGTYYFQNWKRMNEYRDDLVDARRELQIVTECDTTNATAAFKYLVTRLALDDVSVDECDRMVQRFPDRAEFWLYRGSVAYDQGRFDACQDDFARGIALLDDATRETYAYLGQVLPIGDRDRLDQMPPDERETVVRAEEGDLLAVPGAPKPTGHLHRCPRLAPREHLADAGPAHVPSSAASFASSCSARSSSRIAASGSKVDISTS
jgi:tetratricopeptide (TPR) repeat protein